MRRVCNILVICNFSEKEREFAVPQELEERDYKVLISNYPVQQGKKTMSLKAYEAIALLYE